MKMTLKFFTMVLCGCAVLQGGVFAQVVETNRCTVKDSTGTPLNVRSTPGGKKIIGKLKNGTRVFVKYYSGDAKDQSWAEVLLTTKRNAKPLGWVLQDFLDCEQ